MADYSELFLQDSIDKQMTITSDNGVVITNTELHGDEFELHESLCSEKQLKFGSCESSSIKFKISYVRTSLKDHWLTVKVKIGDNEPYQYGVYKVSSDVPTADREFREVEAYDALHDIIMSDVADWYNTILPNENSTVTLKQFRDSFFNHFGITQETINLPQDNMTVEKTIDPSEISGKDVLTAICEINGCFGHIGRDGKFQYVFIGDYTEGLYPRNDLYPANDLYPVDATGSTKIERQHYISAEYEDYTVKRINKLQVRQSENDIGAIIGTGDNCYIVEDNFLVYGKSANELSVIAQTLYVELIKVHYRPVKMRMKGNPTFFVGDSIRLNTKYEIIYTYILERTLNGIQALYDEIDSQGKEYYNQNLNSANKSIVQLRGKTNELTRTVEETNSRITDVQDGLQSQITQNAGLIGAEVTRATGAENNLSSRITQTAEAISSEVTRAGNAEDALSSRITQTADSLTSEVTRATTAEGAAAMVSRINQTAEQISIDADKLNLSSNGWNILANGSFQLGGVGTDAALSYSVGDDYVTLRNDLSLKLHGIPLGGVRYFFTPLGGNYKYDVSSDSLVSLSIGSHTPSFGGTPDTSATPPWKLNVTQYPYYTIVSGFFIISSNFSANYLFNYMLPPVLYTNKLIPGTNYYAGNQDIIFELLKYNTSTGQYSVAGIAHLSNPSTQTIDGVRRVKYSPTNIITDRTLSSGTYRFSLVYDSSPIPFDELLEAGDIYQ